LFYQNSIQAWTKYSQCVQQVETIIDILHGNCNITHRKIINLYNYVFILTYTKKTTTGMVKNNRIQ
jgi:prophage DNA circulation protein